MEFVFVLLAVAWFLADSADKDRQLATIRAKQEKDNQNE